MMGALTEVKETPARILVVDDEEMIRNLLFDMLSLAGYQVKTAKDGSDAIQQVESEPCEIVITDLKMPGISGLEVLKYMLKKNPDVCVIVMTAYGTVESAVSAMKLGAYDYISKPFELEEIKVVVKRAVERLQLLRESRLVEFYKHLSITDGLTKVYNHRYFHEFLERELQRAKRNSGKVTLMFADVDDFKQYNDVNGHLAGDEILRELSTVFLSTIRKTDLVARYGGEEFAVILPDTARDGGLNVASHVMKVLQDKNWMHADSLPHKRITMSIGVVAYPEDALSKDELIKRADSAMYRAKKTGKNKICYFEGTHLVEYANQM